MSDVEHLFMCFLAICMSSLENSLQIKKKEKYFRKLCWHLFIKYIYLMNTGGPCVFWNLIHPFYIPFLKKFLPNNWGFFSYILSIYQDVGILTNLSNRGHTSPGGASGKEPDYQCRRCNRCELNPGIQKIPWRREWLPLVYSGWRIPWMEEPGWL